MQSLPASLLTPDPPPAKETTSAWEILAGIVVGIGVTLSGAVAGAGHPNSPSTSSD